MGTHPAAARPVLRSSKLSTRQKIYIGLSGAFGGVLAILADLIQKEQASAVMKVDEALRTTLMLSIPPLIVALLLVGFAVGLCFVFSVDSSKNAFYRGASILTVLMTLVPYKVPLSIPTTPEQPQPPAQSSFLDDFFVPAVYAQSPVVPQAKFRVDVRLTTSDGKRVPSAIYTLIDATTGATIARSNVQGNEFAFYVTGRDYLLRVEAPNYSIAQRPLKVKSSQSLIIPLTVTWMPLAIQRVWRSPS